MIIIHIILWVIWLMCCWTMGVIAGRWVRRRRELLAMKRREPNQK